MLRLRYQGLLIMCVGIAFGWGLHELWLPRTTFSENNHALRLSSGYTFTRPLLTCDSERNNDSDSLLPIKKEVESLINTRIQTGIIETASVYLRDLTSNEEVSINHDETFYPASLKKLPLLMQYYKAAEANPKILDQVQTLHLTYDPNEKVAYPPSVHAENGKSYTNAQLIEYMIKHSDNTGFDILYPQLGTDQFDKIYSDLSLHYPNSFFAREDYMSAYQFSLFFRTLYNATYLSAEMSDKALELLTQTDFTDGLVRDLPEDLKVAHKFGIGVVKNDSGSLQGELHDCGIVFAQKPYLICVMTKSRSENLSSVADTIATISKRVHEMLTIES